MADWIARSLRDGALDGEYSPALSIKDSLLCPFGPDAFHHFLSYLAANVSADTTQSKGIVLVAFRRSPRFYRDLLVKRGVVASMLDKSLRILDCFSDPLGWKERILESANSKEGNVEKPDFTFKDVRDISKLFTTILNIGKGFLGEGKARFSVAIDSVSDVLRHASLASVANMLSNLRSHDQISCIFWLIHSDLHEPRTLLALEYISTMVASLEPVIQSSDAREGSEIWVLREQSYEGKFFSRLKRRNGRVKLQCEEFHVEKLGIKFSAIPSENAAVNQSLLPKVQFNLQLSEKEKVDKAKVVLPFEHQGNGEAIKIYDGRRSLSQGQEDPYLQGISFSGKPNADVGSGKGEIHYIRDSDDEQPDSDEDPDDDLDI